MVRPSKTIAGIAAGLIIFMAMAWGKEEVPNIVLISIDMLRGDHFTPEHMPLTYDWAEKNARIYTNAHANSTWTKPSHVTMLTGLRQSEHGVEFFDSSIPQDLVMVQERLQQAGYYTAAFLAGGYINSEWGFDKGFDHFQEIVWGNNRKTPDEGETFEWAQNWLKRPASDQPVFFMVHTHMVHQFWLAAFPCGMIPEDSRRIFAQQTSLDDRRQLYADAVARCDLKLAALLSAVHATLPSAIIIIASDHGEGLGEEHGDKISLNHSKPPWLEQTHVPLIVSGLDHGVSDQLVGVDDIAGTILRAAGLERRPDKSLSLKRRVLISEYISHRRKDSVRHVATIEQSQRQLLSFDESTVISHTSSAQISEPMKKQLQALGYLQ